MRKLIRLFFTALAGAMLVLGALPAAAAPGDCAQEVALQQPNDAGSGTQGQFAECSPQSTP